jgi:hypothetical protein
MALRTWWAIALLSYPSRGILQEPTFRSVSCLLIPGR